MNKAKLNYFIDIGLTITFILAFITGIIKWPALLPKLGISYADAPMRTFTLIHDWSGLIMGLLVLVHIALHWRWIVTMTKKIFRRNK